MTSYTARLNWELFQYRTQRGQFNYEKRIKEQQRCCPLQPISSLAINALFFNDSPIRGGWRIPLYCTIVFWNWDSSMVRIHWSAAAATDQQKFFYSLVEQEWPEMCLSLLNWSNFDPSVGSLSRREQYVHFNSTVQMIQWRQNTTSWPTPKFLAGLKTSMGKPPTSRWAEGRNGVRCHLLTTFT